MGDIVLVDLGIPQGSAPGFPRPVVVVTAHRVLDHRSAAQCQHVRGIARSRLGGPIGNVDAVGLRQIRATLAVLFDAP